MTFHASALPRKSEEDTSTKMSLRLHAIKIQTSKFHERSDEMPDLTDSLLEHIKI